MKDSCLSQAMFFADLRSTSQYANTSEPHRRRSPSASVPGVNKGIHPAPSPFNRRSVACPVSTKTFHLVRSRGGYPHRLVLLSGRSHSHYPHLAAAQMGWAPAARTRASLAGCRGCGSESELCRQGPESVIQGLGLLPASCQNPSCTD